MKILFSKLLPIGKVDNMYYTITKKQIPSWVKV